MKNVVRIDLSWKRIMRSVEEQAAYYAAKSGDIDTTYLNGLLTEPDKYHLNVYMREALDAFDVIAEDYPHEYAEAELTMSMPMNYDETRADRLRSILWQYVGNHILMAWMAYIGSKAPTYDASVYVKRQEELERKLRAAMNHRKRLSRNFFEEQEGDPCAGIRVPVY